MPGNRADVRHLSIIRNWKRSLSLDCRPTVEVLEGVFRFHREPT